MSNITCKRKEETASRFFRCYAIRPIATSVRSFITQVHSVSRKQLVKRNKQAARLGSSSQVRINLVAWQLYVHKTALRNRSSGRRNPKVADPISRENWEERKMFNFYFFIFIFHFTGNFECLLLKKGIKEIRKRCFHHSKRRSKRKKDADYSADGCSLLLFVKSHSPWRKSICKKAFKQK